MTTTRTKTLEQTQAVNISPMPQCIRHTVSIPFCVCVFFFRSSVLSLRLSLPPFIFDFLFFFVCRLLLHTVRFPFISTQFYSNCTCALCICRIFYARNASNLLFMDGSVEKERKSVCVCVCVYSFFVFIKYTRVKYLHRMFAKVGSGSVRIDSRLRGHFVLFFHSIIRNMTSAVMIGNVCLHAAHTTNRREDDNQQRLLLFARRYFIAVASAFINIKCHLFTNSSGYLRLFCHCA